MKSCARDLVFAYNFDLYCTFSNFFEKLHKYKGYVLCNNSWE
jgi:hypothetical protein